MILLNTDKHFIQKWDEEFNTKGSYIYKNRALFSTGAIYLRELSQCKHKTYQHLTLLNLTPIPFSVRTGTSQHAAQVASSQDRNASRQPD